MEVGKRNTLTVIKSAPHGLYLDDGDSDGILLPKRYVPKGLELGDSLEVFVYRDSEDRLIATTETPKIMVGQCAFLRVVAVNNVGAFLDWGLPKDLLVPYGQQAERMEEGRSYVVTAYIDSNTNRVVASSRLGRWLKEEGTRFRVGQEVDLLISNRTDLGWKAVINHTHVGLVFHSDAGDELRPGRRMRGYIKRVRAEDERIDLALAPDRARTRRNLEDEIIAHLEVNGGSADLGDHTSPAQVMALFGVSKGNFKKALGALYRARRIVIGDNGITLEAGGETGNSRPARARPPRADAKRHAGARKAGEKSSRVKATVKGRGYSRPVVSEDRQNKLHGKDRNRKDIDRDRSDRGEEKPRREFKTAEKQPAGNRPGKGRAVKRDSSGRDDRPGRTSTGKSGDGKPWARESRTTGGATGKPRDGKTGASKTGQRNLGSDSSDRSEAESRIARPGKAGPRNAGRGDVASARPRKPVSTPADSGKDRKPSTRSVKRKTGPKKDAPGKSPPGKPAARKAGTTRSTGKKKPRSPS